MKQIKNYRYSLLFAGVLLFATGVANAEDSHLLNDTVDKVLLNDRCTSSTDLTLKNGDKVHLEGSCGSIRRQIRKYKRDGLIN